MKGLVCIVSSKPSDTGVEVQFATSERFLVTCQEVSRVDQFAINFETVGPILENTTLWVSYSVSCDIKNYRLSANAPSLSPVVVHRERWRKKGKSQNIQLSHGPQASVTTFIFSPGKRVWKWVFQYLPEISSLFTR